MPDSRGAGHGLTLQPFKNVFRPAQSVLHVVANILATDHIFEFGLPDELCRLWPEDTLPQPYKL